MLRVIFVCLIGHLSRKDPLPLKYGDIIYGWPLLRCKLQLATRWADDFSFYDLSLDTSTQMSWD